MCSFKSKIDFVPTEAEAVLVEAVEMVVDFLRDYLPEYHGYDFDNMAKFHTNYIEIPFKDFQGSSEFKGRIIIFNIQFRISGLLADHVDHKFCWEVKGDSFNTYLWPKYDIKNDRILIPLYREYKDEKEANGGLIPLDIKPNPELDKRYGPDFEWGKKEEVEEA